MYDVSMLILKTLSLIFIILIQSWSDLDFV